MELIQTVTVGASPAASLDFTVPAGYDDLLIVASLRSNHPDVVSSGLVKFNGSSANFSNKSLLGAITNVFSADYTTTRQINSVNGATSAANVFSTHNIYIPNYRSNVAKTFSAEGATENNGYNELGLMANLWNVTDPITSISIYTQGTAAFVTGSTASLYGIRKYNTAATPKATGGIISFDASSKKWVHTFTASGTFTPTTNLSDVEYLVIAGGGGSLGGAAGGGGGAGGYRSSVTGESSGGGASAEAKLSLTAATNYTVTVGAGGPAGTNGSDSTFSGITSLGGGRGAFVSSTPSGGSGGGGSGSYGSRGLGTPNQGFNGGNGYAGSNEAGGGGGGAGAVGSNAGANLGGNGGAGVTSSITGTATARAGGGGGAIYYSGTVGIGSAGGGNGGAGSTGRGTPGLPATGGGAGGSNGVDGAGGVAGGSGIVIVRYAA